MTRQIYVNLPVKNLPKTKTFFRGFTPGGICDTAKAHEVLVCISLETRADGRWPHLPGFAGSRLHVPACLPGSGWAYPGVGCVYGGVSRGRVTSANCQPPFARSSP